MSFNFLIFRIATYPAEIQNGFNTNAMYAASVGATRLVLVPAFLSSRPHRITSAIAENAITSFNISISPTFSPKIGPARNSVTNGEQLITIAAVVRLNVWTVIKFTKIDKLPVSVLVARGATDYLSMLSIIMYLSRLFNMTIRIRQLTVDL